MPSNSELVCWLCLRCGLLFSGPFTLSEPVGCVSGFDYGAMMCHPVEERGCHLGIAEDGDPFTELQVGGDDDAGFSRRVCLSDGTAARRRTLGTGCNPAHQ